MRDDDFCEAETLFLNYGIMTTFTSIADVILQIGTRPKKSPFLHLESEYPTLCVSEDTQRPITFSSGLLQYLRI